MTRECKQVKAREIYRIGMGMITWEKVLSIVISFVGDYLHAHMHTAFARSC